MSSSLAKELARLNQPAPSSIDPELEDFGGGAPSRRSAGEAKSAPRKAAPEGRRLHSVETIANNPRYAGERVSRAKIFDSFNASDEEEGSAEGSDAQDDSDDDSDELEEEENQGRGGANDTFGDEDAVETSESEEEEEEEEQEEQGEEEHDDDDGAASSSGASSVSSSDGAVVLRDSKRPRQSKEHVKRQVSLWCELVGFRIRMQQLLSLAMKLPHPGTMAEMSLSKGAVAQQEQAIAAASSLLSQLVELREATLAPREPGERPRKVARGDVPSFAAAAAAAAPQEQHEWSSVCEGNERAAAFYGRTLDMWHRQTMPAARAGKQLSAVNQPITEQVRAVMAGGPRVLQRAQMRPPGVVALGASAPAEQVQDQLDEEIYNDSAFYQQLLINFVSSTATADAMRVADGAGGDLVQDRLRRKLSRSGAKKRDVDTRASKGRKIRYKVHEKLVNFVAPIPMVEAPVDTEQLFASLFAQH
jgi:protein AATF/BFR2